MHPYRQDSFSDLIYKILSAAQEIRRLALRTTQRMQRSQILHGYFLRHNADCRTRQIPRIRRRAAFALLAGIVQHGSMSFVAVSSPVQDISQSWILSVTYYVIHIFRMGLFFMIAGFFARILLYRRGTRAFVQDRLMRIFVPMVVGWCIFGTLAIVILHWGIARTSGPSNSVPWGFTFLHFWFLYYLIIFYVLALTLREAFDGLIDRNGQIRRAIDTIVHGATSSYTAPIILAAPLFVVLLHRNEAWNMWFGIPTPAWLWT